MEHLARHAGSWTGTNAFRLMPADAPVHADARIDLTLAAGGLLAQLAYTWTHPDDGEQHGLLALGRGEEPDAVIGFWADSWHQTPEARVLTGTREGAVTSVGYAYSGAWRWDIVLDASPADRLVLRMDNVVPDDAAGDTLPAGPYAAMDGTFAR